MASSVNELQRLHDEFNPRGFRLRPSFTLRCKSSAPTTSRSMRFLMFAISARRSGVGLFG